MEEFLQYPEMVMGGWEGRTIYIIKGESHADQWAPEKAKTDAAVLLMSATLGLGDMIQTEVWNTFEKVYR
jgi:hypothetical protein